MICSPDIITRGGGPVCRLGLATRGNTHLISQDVAQAIDRGINYLNWCGHQDGMSQAIRQLSNCQRGQIVITTQFSARRQDHARRELDQLLERLGASWIDVLTFYDKINKHLRRCFIVFDYRKLETTGEYVYVREEKAEDLVAYAYHQFAEV